MEVLPRCLLSDFFGVLGHQYKAKAAFFQKNSSRCEEAFGRVKQWNVFTPGLSGVQLLRQFNLLSASGLTPACMMLYAHLSEE